MLLFTCSFARRCAGSLFTGLLIAFGAKAQTAPNWLSARTIGSTGVFSTTPAVSAVDAAGNVYHAGGFHTDITMGGSGLTHRGNADIYLAKFAPDGSLLWLRQVGSAGEETVGALALDAAGNAYLAGSFTNSLTLSSTVGLVGNGVQAAFLLRYSPQGEAEWAQRSAVLNMPCNGSGVGVDNAGHVYLTGSFTGSLSFGSSSIAGVGNAPPYLARFSAATGVAQALTQPYSFAASVLVFQPPRVLVARSGAVYLLTAFSGSLTFASGITLTSRGSRDAFVARYGVQGSLEWVQQLGGPGADEVANGALDAADNIYLTGSYNNGFVAGTQTAPHAGLSDGYLVKYSAQGDFQWLQSMGGIGFDRWSGVGLDASGFPYVTGFFAGTAQVGGLTLANNNFSFDVAVAAYTPQGQLRWATQASGPGSDSGTMLHLTPAGEPLVFGYHSGSCSFGPYTLPPTASQQSFVATLASTQVLAAKASRPAALALYPNPAHDQLHLPALPAGARLQVLDALGRVARETTVSGAATVSVRGLRPGLYTLRAKDAQGRPYAGRVVVVE